MTRQGKRPFFGIYFAIVLLLLAAYYLYESMGTTMITYAQVQDLFRSEQVESFYVKDGDSLYLSLRGGLLVRNELGSVAAFREDLGELIADQRARGILKDYDYAPVYTPPWWSEILMYVVMIGIIFLFFQYMVGRAQGGGGMDQGRRFGKARIRYGSESEGKVSFSDVAGAKEEKAELQETADRKSVV